MSFPTVGPREVVYENPYLKILRARADFGAFQKEYFVIDTGIRSGLVVVREGSVLLVRQYRFLLHAVSWEIPGGAVAESETPEEGAVRECREETGLVCRDLKSLLVFHPGMDSLSNPTHLFYTDRFTETDGMERDGREVSHQEWVPIEECIDMIAAGKIVDALSILALLSYDKWASGGRR